MAKLSNFKMAFISGLIIGCFACSSLVHAAVKLNKLTACDDIARLYKHMKARQVIASRSCRSPRNLLEKVLVARSGVDVSEICFDQSAPALFLRGFSCIWQEMNGTKTLLCFQPVDMAGIRQYTKKHRDDKIIAVDRQYLSMAAKCRASNGDTVSAQPTLFPQLLSFISSFEFGFITGLGKGRLPDSTMLHGYATTDPTISGNAPSALEFVFILIDAQFNSTSSDFKTVGNWSVHIDEDEEFEKSFNRQLRKNRIPVNVNSTTFKLKRRTTNPASQDEKLMLTRELVQAVAWSLEDESFEAFSDDDIQAGLGMSTTEILEKITKQQPFGMRQKSPVKLGENLQILINERRPRCTKKSGAVATFLMTIQPIPEIMSDYGSVGIMIIGLGKCASIKSGSTHTFINGLIEEATNQLMSTLNSY